MAEEPLSITVSGAGNYINATDAAMSTGAFARHGLVAGQPVTYNRAGDYFYQFADPEDYDSVKEFKDEELKKKILEDEEKKKTPPPTAADPHPPELIPDTAEALAVYTSPDIVKVGDKPVPFAVHGKGSDDTNYSPDVRSNGKVIKRHNSKMTTTYGAEPGNAGVKSGTEGQAVEPVSSSPIVRANGIPVQRHSDTCTLNNGNCPGEYVHVKSTEVNKAPDGNDEDDKSAWEKFSGQFMDKSETAQDAKGIWDKANEWWDDPSKFESDVKGAYESLPTGQELWQGTKNVASGIGGVATDILNDPLGSASSAGGWAKDQVVGGWEGAKGVYNKDGLLGVAGAGLGVAADIVSPTKKAKMAKAAVEGAEELGENAARRSGKPGARSTRLREVKCFDVPPGMDRAELKRQLDEQMKYINENMTADDMAYAHWVLEKAGGTGSLRVPSAQRNHRRQYMEYLESQGKTPSEIAEAVAGQHATHFLDMVAGGHPTVFSRDAAGNPVLGAGDVNSHIGNQWTQDGRAASLREEAEEMRRAGRPGDKMNVELKPC